MKPVIIVCGLIGTGKTHFSVPFAKKNKFVRFNTDMTRKELGLKTFDRKDTPLVNDTMYDSARNLLKLEKDVLFDSAYKTKRSRQKIYEIAKYYGREVLVIECVCSPEIAKERISNRKKDGESHTTNPKVYDEYVKLFEAIEKDLSDYKNDFISYVKLNTENGDVEKVRVTNTTKNIL